MRLCVANLKKLQPKDNSKELADAKALCIKLMNAVVEGGRNDFSLKGSTLWAHSSGRVYEISDKMIIQISSDRSAINRHDAEHNKIITKIENMCCCDSQLLQFYHDYSDGLYLASKK